MSAAFRSKVTTQYVRCVVAERDADNSDCSAACMPVDAVACISPGGNLQPTEEEDEGREVVKADQV